MAAGDGRTTYQSVSQVPARPVPAGGPSTSMVMIEGLEGVLRSNVAITRELSSLSADLKIANDRHHTMFGQQASAVAPSLPLDQSAMVEAVKKGVEDGVQALRAALPPGTTAAPVAGSQNAPQPPRGTSLANDWLPVQPGQPAPPRGRQPADAASQDAGDTPSEIAAKRGTVDVPGSSVSRGAGAPAAGPTPYDQFVHTRDYFGGRGHFTIQNLRRDLGTQVAAKMENFTVGEQLVEDPMGILRHPSPVEGEYGDVADAGAVAAFQRRQKIVAATRGAAQAMSNGATMSEAGLGALGAGAARAAGVAGAAIYGGIKLGQFAEGQRAANNQWVAMTGGDQTDAFEERLRGRLFRWGQFGVLNGEQADQLYRGVAATGMDRDQRGNAQDFAMQNYRDLGMSISQSLDVINFAASHGQESLAGVAKALRDVTEAAHEAGVNTETARQSFVANWKSFSEVFEGSSATAMAAGFSSMQAGLGREFTGIDLSGAANPNTIRMVGQEMGGLGYNEVAAMMGTPEGTLQYTQAYNKMQSERLGSVIGPRAGEVILDAYQNREDKSTNQLNESEMDALKQRLLSDPSLGIPSLDVLPDIIAQIGGPSGLEPANVIDWVVNVETGAADPSQQVAEQITAGKTTTLEGWDPEKDQAYPGSVGTLGHGGISADRLRAAYGPYTKEWSNIKEDLVGDVGDAFQEDALRTGRVGGVSQILAQQDSGVEHVTVETADGERVVSLEDAMRYFRDQIDRGDITVADGENAGATLAEVAKTYGDTSVDVTSDESDDLAKKGESLDDFMGKQSKESGGTVTISPSPWLMNVLRYSTTGNVSMSPEAMRVPPPADVLADGRPSGQAWP